MREREWERRKEKKNKVREEKKEKKNLGSGGKKENINSGSAFNHSFIRWKLFDKFTSLYLERCECTYR
jgi:hypothetical protein